MTEERRSAPVLGTLTLERVRRNWQRAHEPDPSQAVASRLDAVPAPLDPYPVAEELLARARRLADTELRERARQLGPFFDRAGVLLGQMRSAGSGDAAQTLRDEFLALMTDIGDLADVLATTRR